jgi:hypothetical protein
MTVFAHGTELDFPGSFFEDAIEALENAQGRSRVLQIKLKAHSMAELAKRICDPALNAEANMVVRLAVERLTVLPEDEAEARRNGIELRTSGNCKTQGKFR